MDPLNEKNTTPTRTPLVENEMAAANKSLADALRVSFVLLSVGMAFVVLAFLTNGWTLVKTGQVGVKLRFGRILGKGDDRKVEPGLRFSWPKPIGEVKTIPTVLQDIQIDDFWMEVRPNETQTPLAQRTPRSKGLRPGWDGALLTSDRGLVHVKLFCSYAVGASKDAHPTEEILHYLDHVGDLANAKRIVRAAIVNAAIHTAATMTVERIQSTGQGAFATDVKLLAQKRLDAMQAGINVRKLQKTAATVPLVVIPDFDNVTKAKQEQATMISTARAYATGIREQAAGSAWQELAGDADLAARTGVTFTARQRREAFAAYVAAVKADDDEAIDRHRETIRRFGLLEVYADAREQKDDAFAEEVLDEINHVLESNRTRGTASKLINAARGHSGSIVANVAADVRDFQKLAESYEKNPELLIQSRWIETKLAIFARQDVEKVFVTPGQKTVIKISRDPDIARKRKARQLKAGSTDNTGASQWSPAKPPKP